MGARRTGARRTGPAIALALLLHALALGGLAVGTGRLKLASADDRSTPSIVLTLSPPPSSAERRTEARPAAAPIPIARPSPERLAEAEAAAATPRPAPVSTPNAAAPHPAAGRPSAAVSTAGASPGGAYTETQARAALRGFGRGVLDCDPDAAGSSADKRDKCRAALAASARGAAPFSAMDPIKRAAFDAQAARDANCHFYKTPVPMSAPRDRTDGIQFADRKTESQLKPSTEPQPDDSLLHRLDCRP